MRRAVLRGWATFGLAAIAVGLISAEAAADHPDVEPVKPNRPVQTWTPPPPTAAPIQPAADANCAVGQHSSRNHCCGPGEDWNGAACTCTDAVICGPPLRAPVIPAGTHACSPQDATECMAQCNLGHPQSCTELGLQNDWGTGVPVNHVLANAFYRKACAAQHATGCWILGISYSEGEGVPAPDKAKAAALYGRACRGGEWRACNALGWAYEHGNGVPKDMTQANGYYREGCDHDEGQACTNLANDYYTGDGLTIDKLRAASLYEKACNKSERWGCRNLGWLKCHGSGVAQDEAAGKALLTKACGMNLKLGCDEAPVCGSATSFNGRPIAGAAPATTTPQPAAATSLCPAGQHDTGGHCCGAAEEWQTSSRMCACTDTVICGPALGTPSAPPGTHNCAERDPTDCRAQCDAGHAGSCVTLGYQYDTGIGFTVDHATANRYYRLGCAGNHPIGCKNLGLSYRDGDGLPVDYGRAVSLLRRACRAQEWPACVSLGFEYTKGRGVAQDYSQAYTLYQDGCNHNEKFGCNNLGVAYYTGRFIGMDKARARALFEKGCTLGRDFSCRNVGWMTCHGDGVPQDDAAGRAWLQKACTMGLQKACTEAQNCAADSSF